MTAAPVLINVPLAETWDFGDFPYGLEPLTLPSPDALEAGPEPGIGPTDDTSCSDLRQAADQVWQLVGNDPMAVAPDADSWEQLFWFRWITGHQVSFILWQLSAMSIDRLKAEQGEGRGPALSALRQFSQGYCAMLLYTSSCSPKIYESVIRPSMFLQHKGFSGTWAPDFTLVRDLFRGRKLPWAQPSELEQLRRSVRTYQQVHAGVAARLVPAGRSLLQEASHAPNESSQLRAVVFDNFFLTLRASTTVHDVTAQLTRRLTAIALDLQTNGLHPTGVDDGAPPPEELTDPDVRSCQANLADIMARVADHAVEFSALRSEHWLGAR